MPAWRFLTNHAVVLLHVAIHPNSTLREISTAVGLTERAVISIVRALEEDARIPTMAQRDARVDAERCKIDANDKQ